MSNYYQKRKQNNAAPKRRAGNERDGFWVTCPQCQHKFSTPKAWVFKYLERIGELPGTDQEEQDEASF